MKAGKAEEGQEGRQLWAGALRQLRGEPGADRDSAVNALPAPLRFRVRNDTSAPVPRAAGGLNPVTVLRAFQEPTNKRPLKSVKIFPQKIDWNVNV